MVRKRTIKMERIRGLPRSWLRDANAFVKKQEKLLKKLRKYS